MAADFINSIEQIFLRRTEAIVLASREAKSICDISKVPSLPRNILLYGYCGAGNIGADIRMGEIIRQVHHLFKENEIKFEYTSEHIIDQSAYNLISRSAAGYDLADLLNCYDGVIICEGSLFKSQFSNIIALSFMSALAIAAAQRKVSVAYGAEAGYMDRNIATFARTYCQKSLILARSSASHRFLTQELGLPAEHGTDTAWTFNPAPPQRGLMLLRDAGWDGVAKLLCIAPVNPFWWPARPDLEKAAAMQANGEFKQLHRKSIFFQQDSDEIKTQYYGYLDAIAVAINEYCQAEGAFPVLIGMEQHDNIHCSDLKSRLNFIAPIFTSGEYGSEDIVSILRQSFIVISSRYHALVTAMPGCVPGIGITIDERIRNLMVDRGASECVLEADDPDLSAVLLRTLRHVDRHHASYVASLPAFVAGQLRRMGTMAESLCREFESKFPELPVTRHLRVEDYLPPLNSELQVFLHGSTS